MKFVRRKKSERAEDAFIFHISKRERNLLLSLLGLFPVVDAKTHKLSKKAALGNESNQELLVEAMDEQRRGHVKKIESLFKNQDRYFRETERALQLTLQGDQIEWLLQALNDIRVGSWMRLGCPEVERGHRPVLTEETAPHYTAMELSGQFQIVLLEAFGSETEA